MRWLCFSLLLASCSSQLELDPQFASRADNLPMQVPAGALPPEHFTMGPYRVSEVAVHSDASYLLGLGPVEAHIGGNWRMQGSIAGPDLEGGSFECVGPSKPWQSEEKQVHISFGRAQLGCQVNDGQQKWAMLFDVEFSRTSPNSPAWAEALRQAQDDEPTDPRDFRAILRTEEGRLLAVEWAHQTVRAGNVGGYYVRVEGNIVAAVDVSNVGMPKAYLARDAPAELRPAIAATMATVYLLTSLR